MESEENKNERVSVIGYHWLYTYLAGVAIFMVDRVLNDHRLYIYTIASVLGESFGSLLFPFLFVVMPCFIYKWITKKTPKIGVILFWMVWSLSMFLSLFGEYATTHAH